MSRLLTLTAIVEAATGLALIAVPSVVVRMLLGDEISGASIALSRVAGLALLALGLACWPGRQRADSGSPAFRSMLTYNVLIALYLAYLGTFRHLGGRLLWPAVALHAVVALSLVWTWRDERRTKAIKA